jgi:ABC-type branched-subunit amino acid transport system permease subunit
VRELLALVILSAVGILIGIVLVKIHERTHWILTIALGIVAFGILMKIGSWLERKFL